MRPTIYHKPPTRERHIVAPNYTYAFARWLKKTTGRTLCPPHRHIIDRLERARLSAAPVASQTRINCSSITSAARHGETYTPARIIISDPAPDYTHIADLLVHYIHWLRTTILPNRQTLILDRTATAARSLINTLPTSTERQKHTTPSHLNASALTDRLRLRHCTPSLTVRGTLHPNVTVPTGHRGQTDILPPDTSDSPAPTERGIQHSDTSTPTERGIQHHAIPAPTERRRRGLIVAPPRRGGSSGECPARRPGGVGSDNLLDIRASERSVNSPRAITPRSFKTPYTHQSATLKSNPLPPAKLHAVGSGCRPATHRGGTFDIILLLNADTYPTTRHRRTGQPTFVPRPDALDSALDTFLPMLQPHRESILIIHGSPHPRPPRRRRPSTRLKSTDSLTTLTTLKTLTSQNHPPRRRTPAPRPQITPFAHYLNASLHGDLGQFTPIDPEPESLNHHSGCQPSRLPATAEQPRHPSTDGLSQRDSNNEETPCFSTGTASVTVTSPGGTSHRDNKRHAITPSYIPLTYAAAAPAA